MSEACLTYASLDQGLTPLTNAARWLVAFSGGPDSTVLLHLLHSWCRAHVEEAPALLAVHVNHGMQAESQSWQAHCEQVCTGWDIPLIVCPVTVDVAGQGPEAAAREARYGAFEAQLNTGDILFMGHHLDDQVETYFLRLLRGSGLKGLSAMPARRALGEGELIRPLIDTERHLLERYAGEHALNSIDDPSNRDTALDRNYLRHTVLPLLAQRWTGYRQTVARAAEHAASSQLVEDECVPLPATVFSVLGDPGIEQKELNGVSVDVAMIKLRRWLRCGDYPMPDRVLLTEFLRQLRHSAAGSSPRLECSSFTLQRYQNSIYLLPVFTDSPVQTLRIGEVCEIPGLGELSLVSSEASGLLLRDDDRLELRWRQGGERCRPRGRPYSQRLKKLFQEYDVPPWWRERVPLLYLDDQLLAVGDLWLCETDRLCSQSIGEAGVWQLCWQRKPTAFD